MIEGGVAGGSALQQAAQRRATSDRLLVEAKWLEALAADETAMAALLANLPPAYAILHDLKLSGSKGNVDHLVIGPGGAFVVVTRRCREAVNYSDGQLWAGQTSLRDVLDAVRVESQLLTQALQTPVVPVVGLLGVVLPAAVPNALDGVLICSGENVTRVITRGSHTLLPPHKVGEAAERALPLLHNPGSVARTESALGVRADPVADSSVNPVVPPPAPASAASIERRKRSLGEGIRNARRNGGSVDKDDQTIARKPARATGPVAVTPPPVKERSGQARSLRFVIAAVASLCLVAVALGTVVSVLWTDKVSPSNTSGGAGTTVPVGATGVPDSAPGGLAAAVPPPAGQFQSTCPAAGAGWHIAPLWPGDVAQLANYSVEQQGLDGNWNALAPLAAAADPWDALAGQPAKATFTLRVVAVMADGSRSEGAAVTVTAPDAPC